MSIYYGGGILDPHQDDRNSVIQLDNLDYLATDRLKTAIRDSFIDWAR
jgi:hypothetical protein